ncbi:RDD family protein [Streptomyces sp. H27-D2]|uniref:RDD family protein n=1 Tax=Streptomyces sp. H27-D2 TaxID=3046304 RepID=UPI002DC04251|nr:RDD family protein [Streptomyces sp. H27-D2]MEC4015121.1 RDD family protein [Streptomyces sp. H27-D2]
MSAPTSGSADSSPGSGFYPDPSIPGFIRYWNGAAWVPGTSRPAPQDGEAPPAPPYAAASAPGGGLAAPVPPAPAAPHITQTTGALPEETGPMFLDEDLSEPLSDPRSRMAVDTGPAALEWDDPQRLHGNRHEPASAWGADASRQAGFGGEQDRRVSWGNPETPGESSAADSAGSGSLAGAGSGSRAALGSGRVPYELGPGTSGSGSAPAAGTPSGPDSSSGFGPAPASAQDSAAASAFDSAAAYDSGGAADVASGVSGRTPGTMAIRLPGAGAGARAGGTPLSDGASAPAARPGAAADVVPPQGGNRNALPAAQAAAAAQSAPAGRGAQVAHGEGTMSIRAVRPPALPSARSAPPQAATPVPPTGVAANASQQPWPQQTHQPAQPQAGQAAQPGRLGQPGQAAPSGHAGQLVHPSQPIQPFQPAQPVQPAQPSGQTQQPARNSGPSTPSAGAQAQPQGGSAEAGGPAVIPWKPPVDNIFQLAAQAEGRPAGLCRRLRARLIDTLALAALVAAAGVPLWSMASAHIDDKVRAAKLSGETVTVWLLDGTTAGYLGILLAVLLLVGVVYEALPTAKWGHTLGKKLCGVKVLDIQSHDTPSFASTLRRWLAYGVLGLLVVGVLNVLWCVFDRPWRQCWHDKLAGTFVADA